MIKKYYRLDKSKSKHLNKIYVDGSLYIEERTNKNGHKYYFRVEDYSRSGNGIYRSRIKKSVAEHRIEKGFYVCNFYEAD
jgi:hypothetical protein